MNVFDFDKTIYKNDSSTDFIFYLLKHHPGLLRYVPRIGADSLLYVLKIYDKTKMKERFFSVFRGVEDIDKEVEGFWEEKQCGIKKWYAEVHKEDDIVISASPEFLVRPVCEKIGIKNVIASLVDKKTGTYTGINCYGKEKVRRFREEFPCGHIEQFYSDSYSDTPLAEISEEAYLVKGEKLIPWEFRIS